MKTLNIMLSNLSGRVIPIGYEGENLYTRIRINCIEVFSEYPDATVSMVVSPPVGDMYPAVVEKSGVMVVWDITDSVLSSNGSGECQLTFTEGDVVRKSVVFGISINRSLIASGEAPEPVQEWIDKAEQTAQEIAENAAMLAKQDIVESYGEIAPAIIETASGAIASFSDGADGMLVKKMTVDIAPVQDLNGYDHPWPAGGGVNKFDEEMVLGILNNDGTVSSSTTRLVSKNFIPITAETQYSMSWDKPVNNTARARGAFYDSTETFLSYVEDLGSTPTEENGRLVTQFTTPQDAAYLKICMYTSYGTTYKNDITIGLYNASTNGKYYPYSNICPITGWTGAKVTRTGANLYSRENGEYNVPAYAEDGSVKSCADLNVVWLKVKPNTTYHVSFVAPQQLFYFRWVNCDANRKFISRPGGIRNSNTPIPDFTTSAETEWVEIQVNQYDANNLSKNDWQICISETATAYEPYQGETYDIEFPSEAGTVYGGTLDVTTGLLTVTKKGVSLVSIPNWTYSQQYQFFYAEVADRRPGIYNVTANAFRTNPGDWGGTPKENVIWGNGTIGSIYIQTSAYTDLSSFINWLSELNAFAIYELATPVTYQLTPQEIRTLLGVNNIWADTGDVAVEYPADTKLYIDGKVAELQALILENISNS